ncbi:MAG: hypothetical protein JST00_36840 [Deltaproteobacteria bacterium]|nr:hypothetical protein [Deltaproteobacteria bacterium]
MSSEDDLEDTHVSPRDPPSAGADADPSKAGHVKAHADAPKTAAKPESDPHSATIRSSSDDLRDTQATAVVRESDAKAIMAGAAPPRDKKDSKENIRDAALSRLSVPPSEPRGSRTSFSQIDLNTADRPARVQMIVALVLGLVLVAIPLYLWRRPRADTIPLSTSASAAAATVEPPPPPSPEKPQIGEAKVILCQDPGSKKTAPDQCDHVAELEKVIVKAIEEAGPCAKGEGGGAIGYVADVSFKRKSVSIATSKERTTLKSAKAVAACQSAVKSKLGSVPFDSLTHSHARYKIAVVATYAH